MAPSEPVFFIARPGWKFFLPVLLVSIAFIFLYPPLAVVTGILAFYILVFFRDPERIVPKIEGGFISPADGKVVSIIEVPCEQMPGKRARRIAIFLNIFNVHVQRSSFQGKVVDIIRKNGKYMNALYEKCSEENEQVTIWLKQDELVFGIRQIAGAIARRIICNVKVGDELDRGERYGLIQFGSRVELFIPPDSEIKVKPGQKVKGGETCLAVWNPDSESENVSVPTGETEDQPDTPAPRNPAKIAPA